MERRNAAYQFLDLVGYGEIHDDLRYPQLSRDGTAQFVREAGDGSEFRRFAVSALCIAPLKSRTALLSVTEVELECWLTDARLVVIDRRWAHAGIRVGGGMGFVAATARAANEHGSTWQELERAAAMHLRLPWLTHVGAQCRVRWLSDELVRVVIKVDGEHYRVDMTLVGSPAGDLANDILQRTVRLWTTWTLPDGAALGFEERVKFEALGRRTLVPVPRAPLEVAAFPCNAPVTQHASQAFLEAAAGKTSPLCLRDPKRSEFV